jgi:uncharacterized protein YfkK (UPF0435 family)
MDFKLVKGDQIPKGAQIADAKEKQLDVNAIPDLEALLDKILDMLEYINTDEMIAMENENKDEFEQHIDSKFKDLSIRYYSIFRLLMDKQNREENIYKIIEMFTKLKEVKSGRLNIEKADQDFKENMNQIYVYPKWGGKEKFEKAMQEEAKKKKRKN